MLAASMFRIPIKGRPLIRQSHRREKARTATGDVPRPPSWDRRRGRWSDERRIGVSRPDEGRGNARDRARGIRAKISCQLRIPTKPHPIFKNMIEAKARIAVIIPFGKFHSDG